MSDPEAIRSNPLGSHSHRSDLRAISFKEFDLQFLIITTRKSGTGGNSMPRAGSRRRRAIRRPPDFSGDTYPTSLSSEPEGRRELSVLWRSEGSVCPWCSKIEAKNGRTVPARRTNLPLDAILPSFCGRRSLRFG